MSPFRKRARDFNPLPPCGGRPGIFLSPTTGETFQSTPSVWRETMGWGAVEKWDVISIHSLRVEGDITGRNFGRLIRRFQSTPSVWRETRKFNRRCRWYRHFNPLPPCGGRHQRVFDTAKPTADFNPLPPCGGRHARGVKTIQIDLFQSTPSVWRETVGYKRGSSGDSFQSTPSVWRETASLVS